MVMKKSVAVLLASFLFTGILFCIAVSTSMQIPTIGATHTLCSSATDSSCSAGLDHMGHWQILLSAVPTYLTLLIFAFVLARLVQWMFRRIPKDFFFKEIQSAVLFRTYSYISIHPLQDAFSNGILNPKTF